MPLPASYLGGVVPLPLKGVFASMEGGKNSASEKSLTPLSVALSCLLKQQWVNPVGILAGNFISTGLTGATKQPNNSTVTSTRSGNTDWDGATYGATGLPDFPRNVVVTVTHASSIVAADGTISGIDQYGRTITETWSVTATGTSKTYVSKTAFYRVDSITIHSASDASANTLKLGMGSVLGLAFPCPLPNFIQELVGTTIPTAGVIVAGSSSANADKRGTYLPNTIPDGAHTYNVWYVCDDPSLY